MTAQTSTFLIILIFVGIQGTVAPKIRQGEVNYWKFVGNYRLNINNTPYYFKMNCYQGIDVMRPNQDESSLAVALHLVNREMSFTRNLLSLNFQLPKCENIVEGGENLRISEDEKEYKIGYKKQGTGSSAQYIIFSVPKQERLDSKIFETVIAENMVGQPGDDNWEPMYRYKLHAFQDQHEVETLRFLLSYISADWEDIRIDPSSDQWKTRKAFVPLGKLPVLEYDGMHILYFEAIVSHVAARGGLDAVDEESKQSTAVIVAVLQDLWETLKAFQTEEDEVKKSNLKKTLVEETLPVYFKFLEEKVLYHEGFLAYERYSWVDFHFTALADTLTSTLDIGDVTADYTHLRDLKAKVLDLPQIKTWLAKRPRAQSSP